MKKLEEPTGEYALTPFKGWRYRSPEPARSHHVEVVTRISQPPTLDDWHQELDDLLVATTPASVEKARLSARKWWDELILDEALRRGALILTQDLDFTRLLALRGSRLPSVIQLRVSCPLPGEVGAEVLQLLASHADPLAKGCLISLNAAEHRVRLLPLRRAGGE